MFKEMEKELRETMNASYASYDDFIKAISDVYKKYNYPPIMWRTF